MATKDEILPTTLESKITQEGISALSQLNNSPLKDDYFVVGGVAVQSYLPTEYRRPTSDIDVCLVRPIHGREEFKSLVAPCITYLKDRGYEVSYEKASGNFKIKALDPKNHQLVLLEFSRRNEKKYEECEKRLRRELEQGRYKLIGNVGIIVSSPEDIAVPKLIRGIGTLIRWPSIKEEIARIYRDGSRVENLRNYLMYVMQSRGSVKNEETRESARIQSDLYDIACLKRFVGFNDSYLQIALNEWTGKSETQEGQFLRNLTLLESRKKRK